jgi:hypothetical protein
MRYSAGAKSLIPSMIVVLLLIILYMFKAFTHPKPSHHPVVNKPTTTIGCDASGEPILRISASRADNDLLVNLRPNGENTYCLKMVSSGMWGVFRGKGNTDR